jgi:hypothetical protein
MTTGTRKAIQMNLPFLDSKPMMLPQDMQQEPAAAPADLLLQATGESSEVPEKGAGHEPEDYGETPETASHCPHSGSRCPNRWFTSWRASAGNMSCISRAIFRLPPRRSDRRGPWPFRIRVPIAITQSQSQNVTPWLLSLPFSFRSLTIR